MRITVPKQGAPVLIDSLNGMNKTYHQLKEFLQSDSQTLFLAADCQNYVAGEVLLAGLLVDKSYGPIRLSISDKGLCLVGSISNLATYFEFFHFDTDEEGGHHHPELAMRDGVPMSGYLSRDSLSLIVEVDTDFIKR